MVSMNSSFEENNIQGQSIITAKQMEVTSH